MLWIGACYIVYYYIIIHVVFFSIFILITIVNVKLVF